MPRCISQIVENYRLGEILERHRKSKTALHTGEERHEWPQTFSSESTEARRLGTTSLTFWENKTANPEFYIK